MTLSARQRLLTLARQHDALIITDDVYDFLQWPTGSSTASAPLNKSILPRLVDLDRTTSGSPTKFGNTVSNGSFSKIAGPGARVGWAEATPALIYGLSQTGSSRSGGAPSQLTSTFMAQLLRSEELQRHISDVLQPAYASRWNVMMDAISRYLVPLGVRVSKESLEGKEVWGGYFIWITLPEGMSAEKVAERAKDEQSLVVAHGALFEVLGDEKSVPCDSGMRVCFSWENEDQLTEGIMRLGYIVEDMRGRKGGGQSEVHGEMTAENLKEPMGEF